MQFKRLLYQFFLVHGSLGNAEVSRKTTKNNNLRGGCLYAYSGLTSEEILTQ